MGQSSQEYLFDDARGLVATLEGTRTQRKEVAQAAKQSKERVHAIEASSSYRIGRVAAKVERVVRKIIPRRAKAG
jgi:hypothetical protein